MYCKKFSQVTYIGIITDESYIYLYEKIIILNSDKCSLPSRFYQILIIILKQVLLDEPF